MKDLEEKIRQEGKIYPDNVLKVGAFLNHQIDVAFLWEMAEEFAGLFAGEKITKVLTIEASGISLSVATAQKMGINQVIFAKKGDASNMSETTYAAKVYSYTRQREFMANVSKDYLDAQDRVLIIDDFLANGEALTSLFSICKQAGAQIVGAGIVVEKAYQPGGDKLRKQGYRIESLARVGAMDPVKGTVEFL